MVGREKLRKEKEDGVGLGEIGRGRGDMRMRMSWLFAKRRHDVGRREVRKRRMSEEAPTALLHHLDRLQVNTHVCR